MHCTTGDLQILGSEGIKPERFEDDRGETGEGGIGHLGANRHDEKEPCLEVTGGLPYLVPFEVVVLDALAVDGNALHGDSSFAFVQELGC